MKETSTLWQYLCSPPVFGGTRVVHYIVFCAVFCHCIFSPSIYCFWLALCFRQIFLDNMRTQLYDSVVPSTTRRVWRYQRGNQNRYIEEERTTQWPKKKYKRTKNDLQNIHKAKDRVTRNPLKPGMIWKGKQFLLH
jgi:hypothetical protein